MQWPAIYRVSHASRSDPAGEALHQPAHGVGRQPAQRHPIVRRRVHEQLPSRGDLVRPRIRSLLRWRRGSARRGGSDSCIRVMYPSRTFESRRGRAAVHHRRPCSLVRDQRDSARRRIASMHNCNLMTQAALTAHSNCLNETT